MNDQAARPEEDAEIRELHRAGNKDGLLRICRAFIRKQFKDGGYAKKVSPEQGDEMLCSADAEAWELLCRDEGDNPWDPDKGSLATFIYRPVLGAFEDTAAKTAPIPRKKANASKGAANPDDDHLAKLPDENTEKKFEPWYEALESEKAEEEALKQVIPFVEPLKMMWLRGVPKTNPRTGKPVSDSIVAKCPGMVEALSRRSQPGEEPRVTPSELQGAQDAVEAGSLKLQGRTVPEIMQALGRSQASVYRDLKEADDYLASMPDDLLRQILSVFYHWVGVYLKQYELEDPAEIDESGVSDPETEWQPAPKLKRSS